MQHSPRLVKFSRDVKPQSLLAAVFSGSRVLWHKIAATARERVLEIRVLELECPLSSSDVVQHRKSKSKFLRR
jgi:hypothetical protein